MISYGKYKDREAVIVTSDTLKATFLPGDGGKLASLIRLSDGSELMVTKPGDEYKVLEYRGSYVNSECSGFDDMFPTVDPYTPAEGGCAGITYPDHGETCRIPYEVSEADGRVTFTAHSAIFPIKYEKTVYSADDGSIAAEYRYINESSEAFHFLWAGHIMLRGEDGMRVITPFSDDTPTENMFASQNKSGAPLPKDRLMGYEKGTGVSHKFYYLDKLPEGYFGVSYEDGGRLMFLFDHEKLPYLGIWFNNGQFQDGYSITPEPCTVPFDAPGKAADRGFTSYVPANGEFEFTLNIRMEE
ncbi:MAG: hypothetical protein IKV54_03985 [Clostridia bacterium]|nr:hypothetical protein [Clostridia bacterium]